MVNRNLLRSLDNDDVLSQEIESAMDELAGSNLATIEADHEIGLNKIVEGRVIRVHDGNVLIDVGFKSEGIISLQEWDEEEDPPVAGDVLQVLVEDLEDNMGRADDPYGMITLSKRNAAKILAWQEMMKTVEEGQVVSGVVTRKIKGGLLIDIGVNVFLPASQVDIRRPPDIGDYIGRTVECEVLKIDEARRNIVVSRRSLIEKQRQEDREKLLKDLEVGTLRKGVVKNIADFGAFVDLGGIDGLLHIIDMSWGRVGHPSEVVSIDEEIEVMILNINHEKGKIALGLKQKGASPWEEVDTKYPQDSRVKGQVVNVMTYGAFVKLEEGIEGLVHISEMSWTKRVSHPSELVQIGDEIEVVVLGIDKKKQEISLGMKQIQDNPWTHVVERYPIEKMIKGKVRNLTNYGAFIELEEGIDGLLHVSDMSWTRKISHPSEVLEKGQEVECKVLSVDQDRRRIALGLKQLDQDPWESTIPDKYQPGQLVKGSVTKITNFGVFVGLEDGLEGLLHISELADHKVENAEEIVSVGDEIEVKILRVDTEDRKIGLSRKRVEWGEDDGIAEENAKADAAAASNDVATRSVRDPSNLKGGLGGSGPLIATSLATDGTKEEAAAEKAKSEEAPAEDAKAEEAKTEEAKTEEAPAKEAKSEEAPAEEAAAPKSPKGLGPDDLKVVEGIGPKCEEALKAGGLGTWKDLAAATPDKINEILTAAEGNFAGQVPDTWPKQAEMAVAGDWEKLEKWQDELDGGKPPA